MHGAKVHDTVSPPHNFPSPVSFDGTPLLPDFNVGAASVGDAVIVEGEDTMITFSGFAACGPGITGDKSLVGDLDHIMPEQSARQKTSRTFCFKEKSSYTYWSEELLSTKSKLGGFLRKCPKMAQLFLTPICTGCFF